MYPQQISKNLWILGHPCFPVYLIEGNQAIALVEAGISATTDITLEQLAILKKTPDFLIVTHPHSDHVTGLEGLRKAFPQAKVLAGQGAEEFLRHPKAAENMQREDRFMTQTMAAHGLLSNRILTGDSSLLCGCRIVNHNEELDLGGLTLRFLVAQGHSPGNILVYVYEIKALFISDSLGNFYSGKGFFPTFFTGYEDYLATMETLANLKPLMLGLGHNGFFANPLEIESLFQNARQASGDVKNYVQNDHRETDAIASDLFSFYYCDELAIYTKENILNCCRLLARRIREISG